MTEKSGKRQAPRKSTEQKRGRTTGQGARRLNESSIDSSGKSAKKIKKGTSSGGPRLDS